jgi:hypothetical protein
LGLQPGSTFGATHNDIITSSPFPHLAHYITTLLASVHQPSPPRQHPLSVSSSGESDEDTPPGGRSRDEEQTSNGNGHAGADTKSDSGVSAVTSTSTSSTTGDRKVSGTEKSKDVDKAGLVRQIVELLDNEEEEKIKDVLKPLLGELANVRSPLTACVASIMIAADPQDEILMEQVCLDCMHKRKGQQ